MERQPPVKIRLGEKVQGTLLGGIPQASRRALLLPSEAVITLLATLRGDFRHLPDANAALSIISEVS